MEELLKELQIVTQGQLDDATKTLLLAQTTEKLGGWVATSFGVKEHEVAILLVSQRSNILKFEYPKALRNSGTIPLKGRVSSKDAIALRTLNARRGEVINAVPSVKHLAVFEMVKQASDSPQPIQKMLSAVVTNAQDALGVIQVSKKGPNPAAAGTDFTEADLKRLEKIAAGVAPYLAKIVPNGY